MTRAARMDRLVAIAAWDRAVALWRRREALLAGGWVASAAEEAWVVRLSGANARRALGEAFPEARPLESPAEVSGRSR